MKSRHRVFTLLLAVTFLLSACGTAIPLEDAKEINEAALPEAPITEESPVEEQAVMTEETTPVVAVSEDARGEASLMVEDPAWYSIPLTDARTGQSFSIAELKGKVVLVETMAMWCSNCLKQQGQVKVLHEKLGDQEDFVGIGLDIDPNEKADALRSYVETNGFTWLYAVSPPEVSQEISVLYGPQFLNPPSTPIVIIDRKGEAHPLPFGIKSAEALYQAIEPFLNEGR
ncbi:MAG: TlpA family protein disulfide reductase [Anaerolineales bacterium]|nr:TlpA family protein disulfide reductase [Anaerolineales bacterium]